MKITDKNIDGGRSFEWGRISEDYARFRDIYPKRFYEKIIDMGLCTKGQKVLDIGTGTGVLPRALCSFGAEFTAADIDSGQIEQAKRLSVGMDIEYIVSSAEELSLPEDSFDTVTACQSYIYFDYGIAAPKLAGLLKREGRLCLLWMAWLPQESDIAAKSERIILKHNPSWTGAGARISPIGVPDIVYRYFDREYSEEYRLPVSFTREGWHGRLRACRGTGASMTAERFSEWEREHLAFMETLPDRFSIQHYAAMLVLRKK